MIPIRQYRTDFIQQLSVTVDAIEAENIFYLVLESFRNLRRVDLALNPNLEFDESEVAQWNAVLEQLKNEIPVQYILGKTHFCGLEFEVNDSVLIPRPETEELVEWIVQSVEFDGRKKILDIGTGSGCIAISLAHKLPDATVSAMDVSNEALAIAAKNAENNKVNVNFLSIDILQCAELEPYDIIVSNPPYIAFSELQGLEASVIQWEDSGALVAEDDGLAIIKQIIAQAPLFIHTNNEIKQKNVWVCCCAALVFLVLRGSLL